MSAATDQAARAYTLGIVLPSSPHFPLREAPGRRSAGKPTGQSGRASRDRRGCGAGVGIAARSCRVLQ